MISFENDYLEGAHEQVLKRLVETNRIQAAGYGFDDFSACLLYTSPSPRD